MNGRMLVRGWIAVAIAVVVALGIGLGGRYLPVDGPRPAGSARPMAGRTSTVCTTTTQTGAGSTSSGANSQVYGVAAKVQAGAVGTLVGRDLGDNGSGSAALSISSQGQGKIISAAKTSVILTADGIMASGSAGMVYGNTDTGEDRGLSLAPCTNPAVEQWFTGLGATETLRSQLVLTNPDDRQAQVDLTFYGPDGLMSVPGGSGLIIPAGGSRTVSLADLLGDVDGEITVDIKASLGRVAAIARDLRADPDHTPTGADWHPASVAPTTRQIIPAIPGGTGSRKLVISNPGERRADVRIEILGPDGPFAPAGAAQTAVDGDSSTTVDVAEGLAGQIGTIRVISSEPVVTAARSETSGKDKSNDIAIETAQPVINAVGIAPVGVVDGARTELALSNGGTSATTADVSLVNLDGVSLYHEKVPVPAGGSIERRVTQAGPAYLVVKTSPGARLYGGVTLKQTTGKVDGLASAAFITPSLAGHARITADDPRVAQ
jgi:hypothetical protein